MLMAPRLGPSRPGPPLNRTVHGRSPLPLQRPRAASRLAPSPAAGAAVAAAAAAARAPAAGAAPAGPPTGTRVLSARPPKRAATFAAIAGVRRVEARSNMFHTFDMAACTCSQPRGGPRATSWHCLLTSEGAMQASRPGTWQASRRHARALAYQRRLPPRPPHLGVGAAQPQHLCKKGHARAVRGARGLCAGRAWHEEIVPRGKVPGGLFIGRVRMWCGQ
jgi:hypothetical protein